MDPIYNIEISRTISAYEYKNHLWRLDADSKLFRFGGTTSDAAIEMFVKRCYESSEHKHLIRGLYINTAKFPVGHYHIAHNGAAEVSLGIESEYQKRGLGKLLLSNALFEIKQLGFSEFKMDCLKRNEKIVRLIKSLGAEVVYNSSGSEIQATVKIINT